METSAPTKTQSILQYSAFVFVLLGLKLAVIHNFGNATPFWDQWDAEWANIYEPYLKGTLQWNDFFSLVNEHRTILTKLLALAELIVNGKWNPLFQMTINAFLHVGIIALMVRKLSLASGERYQGYLLVFAVVLFGLPYGWENTLAGFQSLFYFVLLFSVLAIWHTSAHRPLSLPWWRGVVFGVYSFCP
ncbi:MAG: hypothetical protein IPK04_06390 [Bdellovibrionales bacterium]|nr:hypothetical protein [Bdellovibrionales bacterium]